MIYEEHRSTGRSPEQIAHSQGMFGTSATTHVSVVQVPADPESDAELGQTAELGYN